MEKSIANNSAFIQFAKFFLVGMLNTGIDFAVYNFLMWYTQIFSGPEVSAFSVVSFIVAVTNSYFLNRYWTFQVNKTANDPKQFVKFVSVSLVGLVLNASIIYGVTTLIDPLFGLSAVLWANLAKAIATGVVLFWNFVGYKFLVFKK